MSESIKKANQQFDQLKLYEEAHLEHTSLYHAGGSTTVPPSTITSVARKVQNETKSEKCKEIDKIYFLKTSKTGSTSIANLLIRFGLRRPGTTFLLGQTGNGGLFFENQYMPFNAESCYLGQTLNPRPVFDISYVHMRYNRTAINLLMHPDHKVLYTFDRY